MNREAFTIIELVIIFLILGIMSAVAIIQAPDMDAIRINLAAYKIQSDIRYAQRLAMQIQRRTAIIFNTSSDNYSIYIENTYGSDGWNMSVKAKNPLTQDDFDVQLNSEEFQGVDITAVFFNSSNYALMFDRNGEPYGMQASSPFAETVLSDPASVTLNGGQKYIVVTQGTGRVNIQDTAPFP